MIAKHVTPGIRPLATLHLYPHNNHTRASYTQY